MPVPDEQRGPVPASPEEREPKVFTPSLSDAPDPRADVEGKKVKDKDTSTFTTVYEETNGSTHIASTSPAPQNFEDADGKWKKIDAGLVKVKGGYQTAASPIEVFLPDSLTATTPVRVTFPEGTLTAYPQGVSDKAKGKLKDNQVTYVKRPGFDGGPGVWKGARHGRSEEHPVPPSDPAQVPA